MRPVARIPARDHDAARFRVYRRRPVFFRVANPQPRCERPDSYPGPARVTRSQRTRAAGQLPLATKAARIPRRSLPSGTLPRPWASASSPASRDLTPPSLGAFSGGDPTQGKYAEAFGAGTALVYWAGVYDSVAQPKWRQDNTCVNVEFTPSSYTVRLVPGATTRVNAERGTKTDVMPAAGYRGAGTVTSILTWDLAREGSSR